MRVAFYAPLKAPDHPIPSGDRHMARAFLALLRSLGHEVTIASRFRSYDRDGDAQRQQRLAAMADRFARPSLRTRPPPELWFTYHCYHKAPDLLGPRVTATLGIPYLIAEPSFAGKQRAGRWASGHAAALRAFEAADLLLAMTADDLEGVLPLTRAPSRARLFPPFIDTAPLQAAAARRAGHRAELATRLGLDANLPWLLAVAMMRADVKRQSYLALADLLRPLLDLPWRLLIVGDGEARAEIEGRFAAVLPGRACFLGALHPESLAGVHAAADLYVWPAFREAYGIALLEAQAAGLPVVAFREGGVGDVVLDGRTGILIAHRDEMAFTGAVRMLTADPSLRAQMGTAAAAHVLAHHDLAPARERLAEALAEACHIRAERRRGAA